MLVQLCFTEFAVGSVFQRLLGWLSGLLWPRHWIAVLCQSLAAIFITTLLLFRLACPRKYGGSEDGIRGRLGVIRQINMDYGVHGEAVSVVGG